MPPDLSLPTPPAPLAHAAGEVVLIGPGQEVPLGGKLF